MKLKSITFRTPGALGGSRSAYSYEASENCRLELTPAGLVFASMRTGGGWSTTVAALASHPGAVATLDGDAEPEQLDLHHGGKKRR